MKPDVDLTPIALASASRAGSQPLAADAAAAAEAVAAAAPPGFQRFRDRVRAGVGAAELLAFRLGAERFAFDVRALDEAVDQPRVDAAPGRGPTILAGLMRHGDRSIPVFDTARVLGVARTRRALPGDGAPVLVMRSGGRRIGLLVDDVDDIKSVELGTIQPPPFEAGDDLLIGVTWDADDLTAILDARALITHCQQRASEGTA
ncbi:MAG TPA: chemotaxis protein CheW [Gemmatimonadaceae bacterium]|nr:chemotaxis protein CheW [Gemmatimonadaceae bacterium]